MVKTTYSQTEYCYYFIISWGAEKAIIPLTVITVRLAGFDPRTIDCFHHASLFGRRLPYSNPVVAELADYRGDEAGQQATQQHLLPAQAHQPVNHTAFHGRKKNNYDARKGLFDTGTYVFKVDVVQCTVQ